MILVYEFLRGEQTAEQCFFKDVPVIAISSYKIAYVVVVVRTFKLGEIVENKLMQSLSVQVISRGHLFLL